MGTLSRGACKFIVNEFPRGEIGGGCVGFVGAGGCIWWESVDLCFGGFSDNPGPSSVEDRAYRR